MKKKSLQMASNFICLSVHKYYGLSYTWTNKTILNVDKVLDTFLF